MHALPAVRARCSCCCERRYWLLIPVVVRDVAHPAERARVRALPAAARDPPRSRSRRRDPFPVRERVAVVVAGLVERARRARLAAHRVGGHRIADRLHRHRAGLARPATSAHRSSCRSAVVPGRRVLARLHRGAGAGRPRARHRSWWSCWSPGSPCSCSPRGRAASGSICGSGSRATRSICSPCSSRSRARSGCSCRSLPALGALARAALAGVPRRAHRARHRRAGGRGSTSPGGSTGRLESAVGPDGPLGYQVSEGCGIMDGYPSKGDHSWQP